MNKTNGFRISLNGKILSLVIGIIVTANLVVGLISYTKSSKAIKESVYKHLESLADDLANQIDGINKQELNSLHVIANMAVFRDDSISLAEKQNYLNGIAARMNNNYENIAYYDHDGNAITADGRTINFGTRPYFTEAFAGKDYISDPKLSQVTNTVLQHYSVPVRNDDGKVTGAIVLVINGNALLESVKNIDMGGGMHPSVINRESQVTIATGNDGLDDSNISFDTNSSLGKVLEQVFAGKSGVVPFYEPAIHANLVASFRPVKDVPWSVFAVAPYDLYFAEIKNIRLFIISIMIVSIIFSIIICGIVVRMVVKPLIQVKDSVVTIATGNADLTQRIPAASNDEIGDVVSGFNAFMEKLQSIVTNLLKSQTTLSQMDEKLQNSTFDASASITEIISNIQSVNNQILSQAGSVNETAGAVSQLNSTVNTLESMIESQAQGVTQASSAVEQMIGNISSVNNAVGKMVNSFTELENNSKSGIARQIDVSNMILQIQEQSKMLQEANKAIASIASETNLLAMNAAIEAAHAGEAGSGFSVVADEIRTLSETSTKQSKTIGTELKKIEKTIDDVVNLSNETNKEFSSVTKSIADTSMILEQIKAAMEEQQIGSKQIIDALQDMNNSTSDVRAASETMSKGNAQIMTEINRLQDATEIIKSSVFEMQQGAQKINETGASLSDISGQVTESIKQINSEIGLFKV